MKKRRPKEDEYVVSTCFRPVRRRRRTGFFFFVFCERFFFVYFFFLPSVDRNSVVTKNLLFPGRFFCCRRGRPTRRRRPSTPSHPVSVVWVFIISFRVSCTRPFETLRTCGNYVTRSRIIIIIHYNVFFAHGGPYFPVPANRYALRRRTPLGLRRNVTVHTYTHTHTVAAVPSSPPVIRVRTFLFTVVLFFFFLRHNNNNNSTHPLSHGSCLRTDRIVFVCGRLKRVFLGVFSLRRSLCTSTPSDRVFISTARDKRATTSRV